MGGEGAGSPADESEGPRPTARASLNGIASWRTSALSGWVKGQKTWLVATVGFGVAIVKILRVTHSDPTTSLAVLSASAPVSVATGMFAQALPGLFLLSAVASAFGMTVRSHLGVRYGLLPAVLVVSLLGLVQLLPIWPGVLALLAVAMTLAGQALLAQERRRTGPTPQTEPSRRPPSWLRVGLLTAGTTLFLVGASLSIDDSVWLPSESVVVHGQKPFTAYVLRDDGRWATLLRDHDRRIVILRSAQVERRTPCSVNGQRSDRSLADLMQGNTSQPRYTRCPAG